MVIVALVKNIFVLNVLKKKVDALLVVVFHSLTKNIWVILDFQPQLLNYCLIWILQRKIKMSRVRLLFGLLFIVCLCSEISIIGLNTLIITDRSEYRINYYESDLNNRLDSSVSSSNDDLFPEQNPISLPNFPTSIPYVVDIFFMGFTRDQLNLTHILSLLPQKSQISRYVPLSPEYETYINYSIHYSFNFVHDEVVVDMSTRISEYGSFGFTVDMGLFWSNRTTETNYKRLSVHGPRSYLQTLGNIKIDDNTYLSLNDERPSVFICNLFVNNSNYFVNETASPHVFYTDNPDHDTERYSTFRSDSKFSLGFDWTDERPWIFLDVSSGPTPYKDISDLFTNAIDHYNLNQVQLSNEYSELIKSFVLSRVVPTFLYEPVWSENIDIYIPIYFDEEENITDYIDLNIVQNAIQSLFPFSTVILHSNFTEVSPGDKFDIFLDYIDSYTDYSIWSSQIITFLNDTIVESFPNFNNSVTNLICGIVAMDRISSHDLNLGLTYAPLGHKRALASVVTIPKSTVDSEGEGLTQTTIHELAHMCSLRHPHDYRWDGSLHIQWILDVCFTPLSYLHSIYTFEYFDFNMIFRGQYRFVFNNTITILNNSINILKNKLYPDNSYPPIIYENLTELISNLIISLYSFENHNYYDSLSLIISCYEHSLRILDFNVNLPDYFQPIVNFFSENNSIVDYGQEVTIDGKLISIGTPQLFVASEVSEYNVTCESFNISDYLYNSSFSHSLSIFSNSESPGSEYFVHCYFWDGLSVYTYIIHFEVNILKINIISPISQMRVNLNKSDALKIVGNFVSFSITSRISVLYGSDWYVRDRDFKNSTHWIDVNKTSGNQWEIAANNISVFQNGLNIIKVRIINDFYENTDSIYLFISGLDESVSTIETSSETPTTPTMSSYLPSPEPPLALILMGSLVTITVSLISVRKIVSSNRMKKISMKKIEIDTKKTKIRINDLLETLDRVDPNLKAEDKKEFKIRRRK